VLLMILASHDPVDHVLPPPLLPIAAVQLQLRQQTRSLGSTSDFGARELYFTNHIC